MQKSTDLFKPIRGLETNILAAKDYTAGQLWFATDTHKIYYGTGKELILMGGGNTGIYYVEFDSSAMGNNTGEFVIEQSKLNDIFITPGVYTNLPMANDLIINLTDSCFYRVIRYVEESKDLVVYRLALSGSGDSGDGVTKIFGNIVVTPTSELDLLNGESASFDIYAFSATLKQGDLVQRTDDNLRVYIDYYEQGAAQPYYSENMSLSDKVTVSYNTSGNLRNSTTTIIKFRLDVQDPSIYVSKGEKQVTIITYDMSLDWNNSAFPSTTVYGTGEVPVSFQASGGGQKRIIDIYFDDYLVGTNINDTTKFTSRDITQNVREASAVYDPVTGDKVDSELGAARYTHGRHTVKVKMSLRTSNNTRGSGPEAITREICVARTGELAPIIWFGEMQNVYYEFDTPLVPIRAYDPQTPTGTITLSLFKNSADAGTREISASSLAFEYWEITGIVAGQNDTYQVSVGSGEYVTIENVPEFEVKADDRHMGIMEGARINFEAKGRSNTESIQNRQVISSIPGAKLENFNWYNNGWIMDNNKNTCLRISNGAKVTFPIGSMSFAGSTGAASHTIEFKMKLSNIQNYNNLLTTYTRYRGAGTYSAWEDTEAFEAFKSSTYSSYDSFLMVWLPQQRALYPSKLIPTYDDLEISGTEKVLNINNAIVKYITGTKNAGICLGTQDGFFSNGAKQVNINFVEDQVLNLAIVYNHGGGESAGNDRLMKFYLNGVLTSVVRSDSTKEWTIDATDLIFDSSICDIDLYKFRVYDTALSVQWVLRNIAYDNSDTTAWDQVDKLSKQNAAINEDAQFSYQGMIDYNKEHPNAPIMPYIVFTTNQKHAGSKGALPWSKSVKDITVDMEFVNTGLDAAYANGELAIAASAAGMSVEDYYANHCPSWTGSGVGLTVQGTSSEFYPRRNYKAKAKGKMNMHRGPYETENKSLKWFRFDNDTVGCNKFTLKVDYMESSGTYNMGLANLANYAYSHHPLEDYNNANAFLTGTVGKGEVITAYPSSNEVWYRNHKGNWKICLTGTDTKDAEIKSKYADNVGDIVLAVGTDLSANSVWSVANAQGVTKVLGGTKNDAPTEATMQANFEKTKEDAALTWAAVSPYVNQWCTYTPGTLEATTISNLEDYRTSVQGFPTLAFWQTQEMKDNGTEPLFIGRYNMLLDKGASEAYGFKGLDVLSTYVGNKDMENVAECWEFENNSRGYCSFRDPWNRKTLSFRAPKGASNELTAKGAPIIADYFEYRYHSLDDYLDYLYELKSSQGITDQDTLDDIKFNLGIDITDTEADETTGLTPAQAKMLDLYGNWEKAVQWVWSTATDADITFTKEDGSTFTETVPNLNTYTVIDLAEAIYAPNKYYIKNETGVQEAGKTYITTDAGVLYELATDSTFNPDVYYYKSDDGKTFTYIKLTDENGVLYEANKYYTTNEAANTGVYILSEDATFDSDEVYYQATKNDNIGDYWKLEEPITWNGTTYEYDTKEYRITKFKKEITEHFNVEYLVTYFIITEALECYDSRGKNCMMASWGPQKAGGDYIWYPIFYDMDTQLGINNTGIPSFDYNVDATDSGCFSTNDSVLWNNLYTAFFNTIRDKYCHLKGISNVNFSEPLTVPIFKEVDYIEEVYTCDPDSTIINSYAIRGERPLIALNLDEQYKYISITNQLVGYQDGNGQIVTDLNDTFFYALQGDRSMARRQFLVNRFNYLDSWLTVDNYARGGANRIQSRVSANNPVNTSDKWIEGTATNGVEGLTTGSQYWKDEAAGIKNHVFDGEYWITMTPVRDMYVTVGTDAANFDSIKYTGTPIAFKTHDLENGVRESGNYKEQLYYIYGLDQMRSLGDLSKLYFQEFVLSGNADKLSDLRLGYDGIGDSETEFYRNEQVNDWSILGTNGLPLVKEINLCNIKFKNTTKTFNLSQSPKLENFRDTGSNIAGVTFAPGVALNTLYLSDSTKNLTLTQANMLTSIIENYEVPVLNPDTGLLEAKPGLYIKGLTDRIEGATTALIDLSISGGNLGYHSYNLLKKYYDACIIDQDPDTTRTLVLEDVQWSPYRLVTDLTTVKDVSGKYYYDNGHYGLTQIIESLSDSMWNYYLNNNLLYEYDESLKLEGTEITDVSLLTNLLEATQFKSPVISGYMYINNTESVDEGDIYSTITTKFPNLHLFFNKVTEGYTARFIIQTEENGVIKETLLGTERLPSSVFGDGDSTTTFFKSPIDRAAAGESVFAALSVKGKRPADDFAGWSITNNQEDVIIPTIVLDSETGSVKYDESGNEAWYAQKLTKDQTTYTFYAVFTPHFWTVTFQVWDYEKNALVTATNLISNAKVIKSVQNNTIVGEPDDILINPHDDQLKLEERARFVGYTKAARGINGTNLYKRESEIVKVDLSKTKATSSATYIAAYVLENVYEVETDEKYFVFTKLADNYQVCDESVSGYQISPNANESLIGKITIPKQYNGENVTVINGFANNPYITHVFFPKNHQLRQVRPDCFKACTGMKYFEFGEAYVPKLYEIGQSAFDSIANLSLVNSLGASIQTVGFRGFAAAFGREGPSTIFLPASLKTIGYYGFGLQQTKSGRKLTIQIGSSGNYSALSVADSLSKYFSTYERNVSGKLTDDQRSPFTQNSDSYLEALIIYTTAFTEDTMYSVTSSGVTYNVSAKNFLGAAVNGSNMHPQILDE